MKRLLFISTFLSIFQFGLHAQVDHWESVVLPGDQWSYLIPESQPNPLWIQQDFDDSNWMTGPSGFGYGDGDDATEIATTLSVYLRKEFYINDIAAIEGMLLDIDFDDGFVAYLNGEEIGRSLVSGNPPAFDQGSDGLHEALLYQNLQPERWEVDVVLLTNGLNLLTVEIHNESLSSSDLTGIPVLSLGINNSSTNYRPTPEWFVEPPTEVDFSSSNLPIVILETNGQEIPNEPKIDARMKIIYREADDRHYLNNQNDPEFIHYDGDIKIEVRGSSSQAIPKKQYGFTTYDPFGEKENVELLGFPRENDWILNALAFDPSLIRDYLCYNLSRQIGQYASRARYCEVILNGSYQGLFMLLERVKADDDRVDINKIEVDDIDGKGLTGGYITKADKNEGGDPVAWTMLNSGGWETTFFNVVPKPEEALIEQTNYIQTQFETLSAAASAQNTSFTTGYPSVIDVPSFVDFMLINELSSNVDAYEFSTFFHKDKNGKLRAGPIWDHNLTFGNDLFEWGFDRSHPDIWQFYDGYNMGPIFWKDLFDDPFFRCYLAKRYKELTQPGMPLHPDEIDAFIDQTASIIQEAAVREEQRWGTVGNLNEHHDAIKSFVRVRTNWLQTNLGTDAICNAVETPELVITKIHYHPATFGFGESSDLEFLEITNTGTTTIDLTGVYIGGTGLVYQFPAREELIAGGSIMLANEADAFRENYGFEPYDEFSRSLENSGQKIELLDGFGNVIDLVEYDDQAPWPLSADGLGDYLEVIDGSADNNDPANWQAVPIEGLVANADGPGPVLTIFPNPVSNELFLESRFEIVSIHVFGMDGKVVKIFHPNAKRTQLVLGTIPKGIYHLRIASEVGTFTRKFIKN